MRKKLENRQFSDSVPYSAKYLETDRETALKDIEKLHLACKIQTEMVFMTKCLRLPVSGAFQASDFFHVVSLQMETLVWHFKHKMSCEVASMCHPPFSASSPGPAAPPLNVN